MRGSRLKISTKVALLFVVLVLFQGTVTLITLTLIISQSQNEAFKTQMSHTVMGIEGYLREVLDEQIINANLLSGQAKIIDYTDFGLKNLLQRELTIYRSSLRMSSIAVYLEPGEFFTGVGRSHAESVIPKGRLDSAFSERETFFISLDKDQATLTVFTAIERENELLGLLSLSRSLDETFVERLQTFTHTTIILSFDDHTVAVDDLSRGTIQRVAATGKSEFEQEDTMMIDEFVVGTISMADWGEPRARIYCLLDTTEYRRLITRYNTISLISTFIILTIALLIGFLFYRVTFNRPFHQLLQGVYKISEGNLQEDFQLHAKDEFGDLAKAFNKMRINLVNRERELLQLSLYNTLILDNVPTGIVTVNLGRKITTFNSAATRILEVDAERIIGSRVSSGSLPGSLVQLIEEGLDSDTYRAGKEVVSVAYGRDTILSVSTAPLLSKDSEKIGTIGIFEDVTKVRQLEQKLAISTRLAALGEMAAGVAHQIRNPLGVMKVSAEMLRDDFLVTNKTANYKRITHMIVNEIDTLNLVIHNLLDFARPRDVQMKPTSIEEVVYSSLENLPLDKYPNIRIETIGLDDVPDLMMDKSLIEQVFSNIVLNAIQASPEDGTVRIRAGMEGERVQIEIEDWGKGFSEAARSRIFDPFYTTKPTGTGLGLSIGHQIIEKHNGTIDVFSEPGKGTTFRIFL